MRQTHSHFQRHITTLIYFHISLPIPICRPWTSLGDTVFTQIVSSYNYERLIRSISTPFCLHNIYTHYLYLYFYAPFTYPFYSYSLFSSPLYLYALFVLIFVRLYSYSLFYYSLSSYSLLLSPLYVHIICTPFSQKIFPKKISTPKAYPKNFPKIFTYLVTSPNHLSIIRDQVLSFL